MDTSPKMSIVLKAWTCWSRAFLEAKADKRAWNSTSNIESSYPVIKVLIIIPVLTL